MSGEKTTIAPTRLVETTDNTTTGRFGTAITAITTEVTTLATIDIRTSGDGKLSTFSPNVISYHFVPSLWIVTKDMTKVSSGDILEIKVRILGTFSQHLPMILSDNYLHQSKPTSLDDTSMGVLM